MLTMDVNSYTRILVIDDDIDLLMLLERRLQKEGFEIETAVSLEEAKEILLYYEPDLVLLDINVQGDDGRRLCWEVKTDPFTSYIKVILMSGYDFNKSRAVLFGADELVPKPLNLEFLLHRVSELLKQEQERN
jgi:DNA-binding response OmpR family regulator